MANAELRQDTAAAVRAHLERIERGQIALAIADYTNDAADDLALSQHEDVRQFHVQVGAMASTAPDLSHCNSVAGIGEVANRFHYVDAPGFADVLPLAHDRLAAYERSRLRSTLRAPHDGVDVIDLTKGVHVPRISHLVNGTHDLHVLPRHCRPLSPLAETGQASTRSGCCSSRKAEVCRFLDSR
jgi:hypothetical protein